MDQHSTARGVILALGLCLGATAGRAADLPALLPPVPTDPEAAAAPSLLSNLYVHVGPAGMVFDSGARIFSPLGRIPGASIRIAPQVTEETEVGYLITPNIGVSATVGVPRDALDEAAGSIASYGKLGTNVAGPAALTAHYHFTGFGRFVPYIGGGPAYLVAFNSRDATLTDFQVQSAWGAVGQIGADYVLGDHLGLFVDIKKAYLRTTARGILGPVPLHADVTLDPLVVSGGLSYRF